MNAALLDLLDVAAQHRDVQTMVAKSLPCILKYVDAERGSIFLLSGEHVVHRILANRESFPEVGDYKVNTALANGLAGWALVHRQGALASNTRMDDRWVSLDDTAASSAIAVPMISRGAVIGILAIHHSVPGHFRERHLASAAEAARLLAPQLDSAMLIASTMDGLVLLCQSWGQPSALLDAEGGVKSVNASLAAMDIVWEGANISQSVLIRELGFTSAKECLWEGERSLASLPFNVRSVHFLGVGVWLQFSPK